MGYSYGQDDVELNQMAFQNPILLVLSYTFSIELTSDQTAGIVLLSLVPC